MFIVCLKFFIILCGIIEAQPDLFHRLSRVARELPDDGPIVEKSSGLNDIF